ncbi:MAG: hypothetical protein ACE141_05230 [Bryobacteraceae bacterium]
MSARSRLLLVIIPLAVVYAFVFSYLYAVHYKIPAISRDGSWLKRAKISLSPLPSLEQALSAETSERIRQAADPEKRDRWTKVRAAAESEINAAHGEGFLIAILSLNIVWMPMIYRWRRKRERLARARLGGSEGGAPAKS